MERGVRGTLPRAKSPFARYKTLDAYYWISIEKDLKFDHGQFMLTDSGQV